MACAQTLSPWQVSEMHPLDIKKERPAHVMLPVLRDIPVTSWKAVLPDKLL